MKKHWKWIWGILIFLGISLAGILAFAAFVWLLMAEETPRMPTLGNAVGLVEVEGAILDARPVVKQIKEFREDDQIKALVLRVESPGGGVAASQEIYEELKKTRLSGKHVVCSMGGVAASGGLYIACAAESILADPGSITGSIGVIMEFPNAQELLKKVGLSFEVIKSAEHKDIGSFWRGMTDREKELLQETVNDVFGQFVDVVAKERKLSRAEVLAIADGRILSGRQAKGLKLVDRLGTYEDAIALAAALGGIKGKPKVVKPRKRRASLFDVFQSTSSFLAPLNGTSPRIEYRWSPIPFAGR